MTALTPEFIRDIPKTDLHLHLDGSLRVPTLIELAQEAKVDLPSYTEEGLRELVFKDRYNNLAEYLHGFSFTCPVLQTPEALERCAYELADDSFAEGVRYLEVRFAPQLHVHSRMGIAEVLMAVTRGLRRAESDYNNKPEVKSGAEPPYRAGIIVCAMRLFTEGFSTYYKDFVTVHRYRDMRDTIALASLDLAIAAVRVRDDFDCPIVGFDLAGREDGYPAGAHKEAYAYAHQKFLMKTVHAGEAFGPESIFQAITELHADRIGHGYHLFSADRITDPDIKDPQKYVDELAQYVADRRITIEVCLTSNLQTMPELNDLSEHRLGRMLDERLSVSLCTDNRLVSNTTVCKEIKLAVDNFPQVTPRLLKNMVIYGFKRSFFPGTYLEKRVYVRKIIDHFERVATEHGVDIDYDHHSDDSPE